ncbi:MAG: valine--tRNA ligase [Spirochaetales bacterium]
MDRKYNPSEIENRIYNTWLEEGYFKAVVNKSKKPFTIIMPPPNITGQLHIGHAFTKSLQDAITRFKRMQGYEALWLPGMDHAAIATEAKVVDYLKKQGLTKEEVGRDAFLGHMNDWYKKYGDRIVGQIKKIGASCDWDRLAFTLDEKRNRAVNTAFVKLYNKGLIYEGSRIINWCPSCKTTISDIEVEYKDSKSKLWHLRYPLEDGSGYVVVATTRPETIPGDTAVAVHPNDKRYKNIVGKNVILPIINRVIPVIADEYVEMDFGSGVVKITPAHDPNDYEVGRRHNLESIRVMNDDATMNEFAGKYANLTREECRKEILKDFEKLGLIEKIEDHKNKTSHCTRCETMIEPIISTQWFVKMKGLAKPAIEVVKNKEIDFHPKRFEKVYINWMDNIQDWCISRQLWSGHRLPVYSCEDCGNIMVEVDAPTKCSKCGGTHIKQDENVLDTWFSSALWPYSTLGWPENTEEMNYFFPTNVMVTGYDIIFFWVARMIFTSLEFTGKIPFSDVYLNGLIRDSLGRKMSKNLGNGVDPLEIIKDYGADAMRFALISNTSTGQDSRYKNENILSASHFINKLWNASNFVLMNVDGYKKQSIETQKLDMADKWILSELNKQIEHTIHLYDKFEYNLATNELYEFVWNKFCDWYIEISKTSLYGEDLENKNKTVNVLLYVLERILKLLHPIIPFATEEIYLSLPEHEKTIMKSAFPVANKKLIFKQASLEMESIMEIVKSIRNTRANMGVADNKKISIIILPLENKELLINSKLLIEKLAGAKSVEYVETYENAKAAELVFANCRVYLPVSDMIDFEKEKERLEKELEKTRRQIESSSRMLSNERFVANAPEQAKEVQKTLDKNKQLEQNILDSLKKLED